MAEVTSCIQGERIPFGVADAAYSAVSLRLGTRTLAMALDDGTWSATVDTASLSGRYRWAVFADGRAVAAGVLAVRPLVSKYAAYVEAIDEAMRKAATNGKYSVTVGELSLTDKTFDEMSKWRAHFAALASAEENGEDTAGVSGPRFILGEYA